MLSDAKIKTLKPQEKMYRVLDAERLYIEIRPSGKKIWRLKYTLDGKEGTISLGYYPAVSLSEARKLRENAKSNLAKGLNPVAEKRKAIKQRVSDAENTFKSIAEEYAKEKLANRSQNYIKQFHDSMKRDVYKYIGNKSIKDVTSADILEITEKTLKRIRSQKNYGTGEVTAIQNRKFIGAVIRYAITTLRADYDPTYAVKNIVERPEIEHARPLEKHEMIQLRSKLNNYGGSDTVKNAGLAMLYTMLRTIEIRRLKWEYIDFEAKTITFPIASKRTGQQRTTKKNRIHIVPMSEQLYELLKRQQQITGNREYVFAAIYKDGMISATTLNRMLDYMNLAAVTAHDFRATASTLLYEKGYKEDWVELQLAHAKENKTRASYDHAKWLADRRKMLQDWADIVDSWAS